MEHYRVRSKSKERVMKMRNAQRSQSYNGSGLLNDNEHDYKQQFILIFSQAHAEFRRAEFESVCRLCQIKYVPEFSPPESHFQQLHFLADGEPAINRVLDRAVLLKSAFRVMLKAKSHEALLQQIKTHHHLFEPFNETTQSWCIHIRPQTRKRDYQYIRTFIKLYGSAINLEKSPIDLTNALNKFTIFELYDPEGLFEDPIEVILARFIGEGQTHLKTKFALSNRRYIGNSTMDPELAFIQANLALASPGSLALDPFCGTGGLLLPAAYFGAYVFGVEIKWDVARAEGKSSRAGETKLDKSQSVLSNFAQYGLNDGRFLGILLADSSRHGIWRLPNEITADGLVDAILADPPYGIREKGQRLGIDGWKFKRPEKSEAETEIFENESSPTLADERKLYPEKQRYEMSYVFLDLLNLGAKLLRIGGRLTFWFPVCRSEYSEKILPRADCMKLLYNCEQQLAKDSARRLLTYEKVRHPAYTDRDQMQLSEWEMAYFEEDYYGQESFRQKIFNQNGDGKAKLEQ